MTERAIPPRRRSVIEELETTSLAVLAADEAHLQGLWDPRSGDRRVREPRASTVGKAALRGGFSVAFSYPFLRGVSRDL